MVLPFPAAPAFPTKHHNVSPSHGRTEWTPYTMALDADAIADCVLATFHQLPDKRKPRPRNDGSREWVPLSGIVLSKGNHPHRPQSRFVAYAYRIARRQAFMRIPGVRTIPIELLTLQPWPGSPLYRLLPAMA
jgi:hypothetical protein